MTALTSAIDTARRVTAQRDAAVWAEDKAHYQRLLDTAVEDINQIKKWNRRAAMKRLKAGE